MQHVIHIRISNIGTMVIIFDWLLNWWKQRGIAWVETSSDGTKIGFLFSFDPFSYHHWEGGSAQHWGPSSWWGGGARGTPRYKVTPLNLKRNPILVPPLVVSTHAIPNIFKNVPPLFSSFQQSIKYYYHCSDIRHAYVNDIWVIPREVAQENPRPPSILMKIDKPIVPHDRNMYAQF